MSAPPVETFASWIWITQQNRSRVNRVPTPTPAPAQHTPTAPSHLVDGAAVPVVAHPHHLLDQRPCLCLRQVSPPLLSQDRHREMVPKASCDEVVCECRPDVVDCAHKADHSTGPRVSHATGDPQDAGGMNSPLPIIVQTCDHELVPERVALASSVVHDAGQIAVDLVGRELAPVLMRALRPPARPAHDCT